LTTTAPANYTPGHDAPTARRILLTASGGPFRTTPLKDLADVTVEQAVAHPKWDMGRKMSGSGCIMPWRIIRRHTLKNCIMLAINR
jgi:1-deoxy-D-xylulose-5-phosphate reductoisomerase